MERKGYSGLRPLGCAEIVDANCWYYYYKVPEGLIELEVVWDSDRGDFTRQVVAFVTDPDHLKRLLGE